MNLQDSRVPFQILAFAVYQAKDDVPEYLILQRDADTGAYWQGVAGGGEGDETPAEAALREIAEETSIVVQQGLVELKSQATIPVKETFGSYLWGPQITVIPEYAFGLKVVDRHVVLSDEHDQYRWVEFETALDMLHWDSNKIALAELHNRILAEEA